MIDGRRGEKRENTFWRRNIFEVCFNEQTLTASHGQTNNAAVGGTQRARRRWLAATILESVWFCLQGRTTARNIPWKPTPCQSLCASSFPLAPDPLLLGDLDLCCGGRASHNPPPHPPRTQSPFAHHNHKPPHHIRRARSATRSEMTPSDARRRESSSVLPEKHCAIRTRTLPEAD